MVAAFVVGSQRLYDFVHDNPMVEMRPVDYTNDTALIRRFRRWWRSTRPLDRPDRAGLRRLDRHPLLLGRRRADGLHARGRAGRSGPSHHRPAVTAGGGTVSRIVPILAPGAGVVTSRAHVRTVVTEYGVADLFGRSIRERVAALVAIAHPDVRDELAREAGGLYHV